MPPATLAAAAAESSGAAAAGAGCDIMAGTAAAPPLHASAVVMTYTLRRLSRAHDAHTQAFALLAAS